MSDAPDSTPPTHNHAHDHDHDHDHDHHHDHVPDGAGYFDSAASSWDDDPAKVERAQVVAEQIIRRVSPTAGTSVFEYGAGTGLVSQYLQGSVGPLTLADPSEGMRSVMAAKVAAGVLPDGARIGDLDLATHPAPDGERFDLVVTVQVLHHVSDLEPVLAGFVALVAPGGHLCIADLEAEDGSFHGDGFGGHHGFDRDDLGAQLRAAGFADVTFEHSYDMDKGGHTYPLFLAIATR